MAATIPRRWVKRLETLASRQAKVRADLRAFQGEVEDHLSDNDEAKDALDCAIDALSRLV